MSREQGSDGRRRLEHFNVDMSELVDGYQFDGRARSIAQWRERKEAREFKKLCARLRSRRWRIAVYAEQGPRLDSVRANARAYYHRNAKRLNEAKNERRRRARALAREGKTQEWTCEGCGASCSRPFTCGPIPTWCDQRCSQRARYRRRVPVEVTQHRCTVCDTVFERAGVRGGPPKYCSTICKSRARAVRRRGEGRADV